MLISHNKINEIIDDAQPYAKIVCDKLSNKVTDDIGRNEYFMNILDKSFDIICESEIEHLKDIFDVYLLAHKTDDIDIKNIPYVLEEIYDPIATVPSRGSNKIFIRAIITTVRLSVKQAFSEKLLEYVNTKEDKLCQTKSHKKENTN